MIIILSICSLKPVDGREVFKDSFKIELESIYQKYPRVKMIINRGLKYESSERPRFNELFKILDLWSKDIKSYAYYEIDFESKLEKILTKEIDLTEKINNLKINGDNCMKNNLFINAINNFVKIYEIIKRDKKNNEANKKLLFEICIKIAKCNKELLNYDEALNIYSNLYENEKIKQNNKERFIYVSYEYAYLLSIKNKCNESNQVITVVLDYLSINNLINNYLNYFLKFIELKRNIFWNNGNFIEANELFLNIKNMYDKYKDHLEDISMKSIGCKFNSINYHSINLSLIEININYSNFDESEKEWNLLLQKLKKLFYNGENELINKTLILLITLYHQKKLYKLRDEKILELEEIYKNYDQIRLINNPIFMDFILIKYKIINEEGQFNLALLRIKNILKILKFQNNQFYIEKIKSIKSEIYIKTLKLNKAMNIQKESLKTYLENSNNIKNYNKFIDIHIKMSEIYFLRSEFHKSFKCLKFILQEYFLNENLSLKIENLCLSDIYIRIAHIKKKYNDLKSCLKYMNNAKDIFDKKLKYDKYNWNFLPLNKLFSRYYFELNNNDLCFKHLNFNLMILKYNYKNEFENKYEIIPLYREYGNYYKNVGDYDESLENYKYALKLCEKKYGTINNYQFALTLNDLANLCLKFKKHELAEKYYNKCIEINEKYKEDIETNIEIATNYFGLGNIYLSLYKYNEALTYYYKSQQISDKISNNNINLNSLWCEIQISKIITKNDLISGLKSLNKIKTKLLTLFGSNSKNHPIIKSVEYEISKYKN